VTFNIRSSYTSLITAQSSFEVHQMAS